MKPRARSQRFADDPGFLGTPRLELANRRQPVRRCFACRLARPPYVYAENGHDYCQSCARKT